jgi:rhodanese-related sulfurtransferase/energy-converting hydrogenase Eha subunit C
MNFPLFKFEPLLSNGFEQSLIVAIIIGIAFGFVLERAGFGSCRKLAAQFYFKDLAVFKVMFTAIVTAMVGVYLLSVVGVLDINLVYKTDTIIWPQILGGLLLGVGFVIGGYCPGTSVAAAGTGKIDALVFLGGVMLGLFGYGEIFMSIKDWAKPEGAEMITLDKLTGIPYGILVFAVVLMAVGGFIAAEWAERKFSGKEQGEPALSDNSSPLNTSRLIMLALLGAGFIGLFLGSPYRGTKVTLDTTELARLSTTSEDKVKVEDLADSIMRGDDDYLLIDVRDAKTYATSFRIKGAVNMGINSDDFAELPMNENILIYSDNGEDTAKAWFILKARGYQSVRCVEGGIKAWMDDVLFPSKPAGTSKADAEAWAKKVAVAESFGGKAQEDGSGKKAIRKAPTPPPAPAGGIKKKKKRKAREGC